MVDLYWFSLLVPTKSRLFPITWKEIHRIHYWNYLQEHGAAVPTSMKSVLDSPGGPNHCRLMSSLCLMAVRVSCLFYRFCCSAVRRWSRSSASNRICCVNERNSYKAKVSHQMLFNNMLKSFKITFLTKGVVKILYILPSSSISLIKGVSSFSLPGWACLSSAGCASVCPPLSSSPPCCSARLFQTPSSPSLSSSAPAACLSVQLPEKPLSDCDFPADAGEKKQKTGCCCTVRPRARDRCPDLADSWRSGDVQTARLLPELCQPNKYVWKLNSHFNAVISPAP